MKDNVTSPVIQIWSHLAPKDQDGRDARHDTCGGTNGLTLIISYCSDNIQAERVGKTSLVCYSK